MKTIFLIITILFTHSTNAQQYFSHPGLDKFAGTWQYINGQDTIMLKSVVKYFDFGDIKVKGALFYYTYKSGNSIIWNNLQNSSNDNLGDFSGSLPFGSSLDSLKIGGTDKLKRKTDEGLMIINSLGNQLTFIRDIGINGGGVNFYAPGEGPLPGFTLPATIIFTKYVRPIDPDPID